MTVYGYCRASGDTSPNAQTIDGQHTSISRWADYAEVGPVTFMDEVGVSGGKKFAARPVGGHIMRRARSGDTVVVTKLDRLGRDVRDVLDVVDHMRENGVRLVIIDMHKGQGVDTSTPVGEFMLTMVAALAALERKQVGERLKAAWKELDRQGRHHGKVPFGLQAVPNPNGKGKVLRPDPETGPVLHKAIGRIIDGATLTSQAEELGLYTVTLSRLLRNPKLYGKTPQTGRIDPEAGILTAKEWERLQKVLERPARGVYKTDSWSHLCRCYHCGGRLYRVRREQETWADVYRCTREPRHEGAPTVSRPVVDGLIEQLWQEHYAGLPIMEMTEEVVRDDLVLIESEIKAVTEAMVAADDVTDLVAQLTDLKRRQAERGSQEVRRRWHLHPNHKGDDVKEHVIAQVISITVHPATVKPRLVPNLQPATAFARLGVDHGVINAPAEWLKRAT